MRPGVFPVTDQDDKIKFIGKKEKGLRQKDKILLVWFSLFLLLPGEFIRNTGPAPDASWAFFANRFFVLGEVWDENV